MQIYYRHEFPVLYVRAYLHIFLFTLFSSGIDNNYPNESKAICYFDLTFDE